MQQAKLRQVIEPVLVARGLELEDLTIVRAGTRRLLRVTVDGDGPEGSGPSLDEIAAASADLSRHLDDSPAVGDQPYVLEVSSRGVDRPLTRPAHWRRNHGRLVAVSLTDGAAWRGRILSADASAVRLSVGDSPRDLPFDAIAQAVVEVELNRPTDLAGGESPDSEESQHGH